MSRPVFLVLILLLLAGGIYYLSTVPVKAPTTVVEVDAQPAGNAN